MHKIVVAITGASGSIYPKILLTKLLSLKDQWSSLGVIITDNAKIVWQTELGDEEYKSYDAKYFSKNDFMAPFASGSGAYDIMIIAPCSMGTLGRIASGVSGDLISRAADVILKERRKLICVIRETPYNLIHIRNMETVTVAGRASSVAWNSTTCPRGVLSAISALCGVTLLLGPRWKAAPPL